MRSVKHRDPLLLSASAAGDVIRPAALAEVSTDQEQAFIFPTGRAWAMELGYPEPELSRVPDASVESDARSVRCPLPVRALVGHLGDDVGGREHADRDPIGSRGIHDDQAVDLVAQHEVDGVT
jgi:hypothetical protein